MAAIFFRPLRIQFWNRSESTFTRIQEFAMSFLKNVPGYVEIALIVVLGLVALAGIIRFVILSEIF
jgi:hypothetical protein